MKHFKKYILNIGKPLSKKEKEKLESINKRLKKWL